MLRFILLILYIMDTMFIKYLIFIWWGPSRFSVYHISQSTNSLLFSPILFDCYSMEIILENTPPAGLGLRPRRSGRPRPALWAPAPSAPWPDLHSWLRAQNVIVYVNLNSLNKSLICPYNLLVCRNRWNNTSNV